MPRIPSLLNTVIRWVVAFTLVFVLTLSYYREVMLRGDAEDSGRAACNVSTSSNAVCDSAVAHKRLNTVPWTGGYTVLTPGLGYFDEVIRNPSLSPTMIDTLKPDCPQARRYVLDAVQPEHLYFVRLCHKGSPSVKYHVRLMHVRRSSLHGLRDEGRCLHSGVNGDAVRRVADPLDTEVLSISMHCSTGSTSALFQSSEASWCDAFDLSKGLSLPAHAEDGNEDPFLPVLEVSAETLALTAYPELFPCLTYNLHLDDSVFNAAPLHVLPAMLPFVLFALVLTLCLPWLVRRMQDPAEDKTRSNTAVTTAEAAAVHADTSPARTRQAKRE